MARSNRNRGWLGMGLALAAVLASTSAGAAIHKIVDRQEPTVAYCPFDLNGWEDGGAPVDLSFVAPSSSVRITLSVPNYFNGGFVNTHLDNVSVVLKSVFPDNPANVHAPLPAGPYYDCYAPPGTAHTPSFVFTNFAWPGPVGPLLSLFDTDEECWTGDVYFDPLFRAPRDPVSETDTTGGSLGIGKLSMYEPGVASASRIVTGLVPGQAYVVFAWWYSDRGGEPLTIAIDSAACVDQDADGFVDCSGCAPCELQAGQACGDCDDTSAAIRPSASDATCDGIDQNCSEDADEGSPGGCQCVERAAGITGWWSGDGHAQDLVHSNDGTVSGPGSGFTSGFVGETFYFAHVASGGVELPDDDELEFSSQMTIEAWILPNELDSTRVILGKWDTFDKAYTFETEASRSLAVSISNGSTVDALYSPTDSLRLGVWTHVATTFDAGRLKLYIDGEMVASKMSTVNSIYDQGATAPHIGRYPSGNQFAGYIDELALYDRALSAAEVRAIYDLGAAGFCKCADADGDGYGDGGAWCPSGAPVDCDDTNPNRHPGAAEACNGLDDDCDGTRDEGLPQALFYRDQDMDGFGNGSMWAQACAPPPGYVIGGTDCNDLVAAIHPGAPEMCNGLDDDCDLQLDEGLTLSTFYRDVDLDGYGSPATTIQACSAPAGYVAVGGDCNDADPAVNPGVADGTCNGLDENCDGQADDDFPGGCQCTRPASGLINWWPGDGNAFDIRGAQQGTPLNGATYAAGQVAQAFSFDGVNDFVRVPAYLSVAPVGEVTVAFWQKVSSVKIQSTFSASAFVDGSVFNAHVPYNDGKVYWDFGNIGTGGRLSYTPPVSLVGTWQHFALVASQSGNYMRIFRNGVLEAEKTGMTPFARANLDLAIGGAASLGVSFGGEIDEFTVYDRALDAAEIRVIHALASAAMCRCTDADLDGFGATAGLTCPGGTQQDCNDGQASSHPGAPELCNGVDDDCDGTLDEGLAQSTFHRDADGDGYGATATTIQACAVPAGYVTNSADCNDADALSHPGAVDATCDGVDQNCSGVPDESFVSPPDGWIATPLTGAPSARRYPTMVSTGDSVIVWGGSGTATNQGAIYRPTEAIDAWTPTQSLNAPSARYLHTAVWTGSEMIVWGGLNGGNTGGVYNPGNNSWTAMTLTNAPSARQQHSAVWAGTHMIVWGGSVTNTGGAYQPGSFGGTWTALPTPGAPTARSGHTAVWTGGFMVVWGGFNGSLQYNTGGRYSPSANAWSTMAASPLAGRSRHTTVWTGSKMIVWGGYNGSTYLSDGAMYDPTLDSWTTVAAGPPGRYSHTAIWDPIDARMVVWGGLGSGNGRNDGWAYDPVANTWTALPTTGAPGGRFDHAAAWLSSTREMVVWGGATPANLNTGGRIVVTPFDCGVGSCMQPSRYTCTAGQLGYGCTPGTPSTEICNGVDDDCDSTIDDGIPAPSGRPNVHADKYSTEQVLGWSPVAGATGYDVVRGSLSVLRSSGGDFTASTTGCPAEDTVNLFVSDASLLAAGDGVWQLVRAVNACGGNGSYDTGSTSQQGSRDSEIAAAPLACP